MSLTPLQVLQEHFGYDSFRPGQKEVVEALLQGKSAAAVFPTGAGKSLCYQLPATIFEHLTLVVSPLMALMKDQVDALQEKKIAAARLDSSLSFEEYNEVLKRARSGELKLLYVAPERFNNERFRETINSLKISLMAIDEAHCVSEWGHNFRPDYLKLSRFAGDCGAERILALTATATPQVLEDICERFQLDFSRRLPFFRPNLHLKASLVGSARSKLQLLASELEEAVRGSAIVYVALQKTAVAVAQELRDRGFEARPYHAGLPQELRAETQDWFLRSQRGIVVATIAFGMGIDKPDIRAVFHYDPPKSLENYSQEIGRAGRDGEVSLCRFFYYPPDRIPLENFVYGDTPTKPALQSLLSDLFKGDEELVLNLHQLSREHDVKLLVLKTLLTYLELENYLRARTPIYASYRFKPAATSKEILSSYSGEEQHFLANVLKHSKKKKIWFEIDIEETASSLHCNRSQVVRILDRCEEDGWLELKASDLRYRYSVLRQPDSLDALADELHRRAVKREADEVKRLGQALSLATEPGCLAGHLSAYFGEQLPEDCGVCSSCLNGAGDAPLRETEPAFELGELPQELTEPRAIARYLCGITSPALSRMRLTRDPGFGRLSHISFSRVLEKLAVEHEGAKG